MKKIIFFMVLALTLCVLPASPPAEAKSLLSKAIPSNGPASFADIVEHLLPAVVNISSTQKMDSPEDFPELPQFPPGSPFEDFFEDFMDRHGGHGMPAIPATSLGSGFIVDAEKGYIVTNNHVIREAQEVRVTLSDDETIPAKVIGYDEKTDLAVLQIETKKKLTAVTFGESDSLRVGDWIVAVGNPFGLGGTVTAGIVSARQRNINSGPYDDYIQTDASINRGNSGGPMFDLEGKVIGINTAIFSPSGGSVGIGFAIPSSLAKPVIDQIIQYGRTRRGWLGVRIQSITDEIAESLGLSGTQGALVASVSEDGPAAKAGIQTGDVITEFNGKNINEMRTLPRMVAETMIDSEAEVKYWREGKEYTTKVKVGELEKAEEDGLVTAGESSPASEGTKAGNIGVKLSALSDRLRQDYSIPTEVDGVVITSVEDLSEAAEKGLMEGDVIVEINQQAISDPAKAAEIVEKAEKAGRSSILLLINRSGDVRFIALRLKKEE